MSSRTGDALERASRPGMVFGRFRAVPSGHDVDIRLLPPEERGVEFVELGTIKIPYIRRNLKMSVCLSDRSQTKGASGSSRFLPRKTKRDGAAGVEGITVIGNIAYRHLEDGIIVYRRANV